MSKLAKDKLQSDGMQSHPGIYSLEAKAHDGGELSYEIVGDNVYKKLLRMVKTDALDWDSYTDPKLRNLEQDSDTAKRLEVERSWAISRPNGKIPSDKGIQRTRERKKRRMR